MRNMQMEVRPISGALGAEIFGVDFAAGVDEETFDCIRTTFLAHGVIVIRDQDLTPEQHVAAARRFGDINVNRFFMPVDGHPEVAEVRKEPHQKRKFGNNWHTDHSCDDAPALGSMIYALEVPPVVRFDGWTEEESRPLLDYLYEHASKPEFTCRVEWRKGSLGLWDNRATWHLALNDYPGHRRLMHRVTIEGTTLSA